MMAQFGTFFTNPVFISCDACGHNVVLDGPATIIPEYDGDDCFETYCSKNCYDRRKA